MLFLPVWRRLSQGKARGVADIETERAQVDDIGHVGHASNTQLRQLHLVFQMRHGGLNARQVEGQRLDRVCVGQVVQLLQKQNAYNDVEIFRRPAEAVVKVTT